MEYYSAIKKSKIMSFAAIQMDLEIIILSEVSQTQKDKYHMIPLIGRIWIMTQMNLSTKQKHNHRHTEQPGGCQGGGEEGRAGWGVWD